VGLWVITLTAGACYGTYSHPSYVSVYSAKALNAELLSLPLAVLLLT